MKKKSALVFMWRIIGMGTLFLMHTAISNHIGVSEYGVFSLAITISAMAGLIAPLGWPTAVIRFIAEYKEKKNWPMLKGMFVRASQTTLIVSLLLSFLLYSIAFLPATSLSRSLMLAAFLLPVSSFVSLRRKSLQGLNAILSSLIPDEVLLPLIVLIGVFFFPPISAEKSFTIYFTSSAIVMTVSMWLLTSRLKPLIRNVTTEYDTRFWLKVTLPMLAGGISGIILARVDQIMLGIMRNCFDVGLYSVAYRIATLTSFGLGVVATVTSPLMSKAFSQGKIDVLHKLIYKGALISGSIGLVICTLTILYSNELMTLFGGNFSKGNSILIALSLGQLINASTGPVGFALLLSGNEKQYALFNMYALFVNIIGNLIAIFFYGALGAALVSAFTIMGLNTSLFLLAKKKIGNCSC